MGALKTEWAMSWKRISGDIYRRACYVHSSGLSLRCTEDTDIFVVNPKRGQSFRIHAETLEGAKREALRAAATRLDTEIRSLLADRAALGDLC